MKFISLYLLLLITNNLYAQKKGNDALHFQITCGFAAQTGKEIQEFKKIVSLKDSTALRNKLFKGSELEQVLSVIMLRHYNASYSISLSPLELNRLSAITKSKRKFELCFTCTFQEDGTLKELFSTKKPMASYEIIKKFLLDSY